MYGTLSVLSSFFFFWPSELLGHCECERSTFKKSSASSSSTQLCHCCSLGGGGGVGGRSRLEADSKSGSSSSSSSGGSSRAAPSAAAASRTAPANETLHSSGRLPTTAPKSSSRHSVSQAFHARRTGVDQASQTPRVENGFIAMLIEEHSFIFERKK